MIKDNKFIRYFRNPLHGISASTSYRVPNSLVHLPVILMVPYIGILVCGAEAKALLPVYFVVALYAGRDLVITAYRNYAVPVILWGIFIPFIVYKDELSRILTPLSQSVSIAVTGGVIALFLLYIKLTVK